MLVAAAGAAEAAAPLHVIDLDVQGGSIWVPVRVNGSEPLRFLLDSGAGGSVVARETAERLGLQLIEMGEREAGSAETKVRVAASPNVQFEAGGARWTSHAGVVSMEVPSSSIGRRYDGVLGYDFLAAFVVEVDYARAQMKLYDPGTFQYGGKGAVVPLRFEGEASLRGGAAGRSRAGAGDGASDGRFRRAARSRFVGALRGAA